MIFKIYETQNGWYLSIQQDKIVKAYVYKKEERITMLAKIDKIMGPDPGEELEDTRQP